MWVGGVAGIKLAAPRIAERGGGSISSTASIAAIYGYPGLGAYGAAKACVTGLTRVVAVELAHLFMRVNCILPGGVVTPLIYDSPVGDTTMDPDVIRAAMAQGQPIPRAGEPADIANAALWLASDESSFVTGQAIVVDGGATIEPDPRMRRSRGSLMPVPAAGPPVDPVQTALRELPVTRALH